MHPKLEETHALIDSATVARIIIEFNSEFRDVYPRDIHLGFAAVGPLQSLIGMAIKNGHLSATPSEGGDGALREALAEMVEEFGSNEHDDCECISCCTIRKARAALALPAAAGWQVKLTDIADQVPLGYECRSCGGSAYNWIKKCARYVDTGDICCPAFRNWTEKAAASHPSSKGGDPASTGAGDD